MTSKRKPRQSATLPKRPTSRPPRRKFGVLTIGLAAGAVILALTALALWSSRDPGASSAAGSASEKAKGPASAPVTVVEYADFQCPACRRFAAGPARQLEAEYVSQGQVRFVFQHYAFLGQESRWAAEASECANEQGKFWEYYDKLFAEQGGENVGVFSKQNLQRFAGDLGLEMGSFSQCLTTGKYAEKVLRDVNTAGSKGVRGTPTLFVNGRRVDGGSDYAVLRQAIEAALSAD